MTTEGSEKKKRPGVYDRIIVAIVEDEPVFSALPMTFITQDGKSIADIFYPFEVQKRLNNLNRKISHSILLDNQDKTICVFTRIEKGMPQYRVDKAIRELNEDFVANLKDSRKATYDEMVENWYEKFIVDYDYRKKNLKTNNFEMVPFEQKWMRGKGKSQANIDSIMTDEASASDAAPDKGPSVATMKKARTALPSQDSSTAAHDMPLRTSQRIRGNAPVLPTLRQESVESDKEPPSSQDSVVEPANIGFIDDSSQEELETEAVQAVEDITSAFASQSSSQPVLTSPVANVPMTLPSPPVSLLSTTASQPATTAPVAVSSYLSSVVTAETLNVLARSTAPELSSSSMHVPATSAAPVTQAAFVSTSIGTLPPVGLGRSSPSAFSGTVGQEVLGSLMLDVATPATTQFVTKEFLDQKLTDLFLALREAAKADMKEINDARAGEMAAVLKKIDNKFGKVNDVKKICEDINSRTINLSNKTYAPSPLKTFRGNMELKSKGRSILFRPTPFNRMGKECDVYFSFPFVQEQCADLIGPYLNKMQLVGMNSILAKTLLHTLFTPLARSHMIYGKNKNSTKMQYFYKRPIPPGLFTMVDKNLILKIQDALALAPGADLSHVSEMRDPCASAFNIDRTAFINCAIKNTATVQEAAEACVDMDFEFYNWNKHTLPTHKKSKLLSREKHLEGILSRGEMIAATKSTEVNPGPFPPKDRIFDEMKGKCVYETDDCKEIIKLVCASAHVMGVDYKNLQVDFNEKIPELPALFAEVIDEIEDINALVRLYSADAADYLPDVVIPQEPKRKRATPSKRPRDVFPFHGVAKRTRRELQESFEREMADEEVEVPHVIEDRGQNEEVAGPSGRQLEDPNLMSDYEDEDDEYIPRPGPGLSVVQGQRATSYDPPAEATLAPRLPDGFMTDSSSGKSGSATPKN